MAKRPDLAAIAERAGVREAPAPPAPTPSSAASNSKRQPSRVGKVSITVYYRPEVRKQLRRLALDQDRSLQALVGEAINDLFAKHGLPELVEPE